MLSELYEINLGAEAGLEVGPPHQLFLTPELDTPLMSRRREMGTLLDAFDAAIEDRQVFVTRVLGPAGIGKTHLLLAAVRDLLKVDLESGTAIRIQGRIGFEQQPLGALRHAQTLSSRRQQPVQDSAPGDWTPAAFWPGPRRSWKKGRCSSLWTTING